MKSAAQNWACLLETELFTVVVGLQEQGLLPLKVSLQVADQEKVRPAVHLVVGLQEALKAHQVPPAVPKVELAKRNKIR